MLGTTTGNGRGGGRIKTYADCIPPLSIGGGGGSFLSTLRQRSQESEASGKPKRDPANTAAIANFTAKLGLPISYGNLGSKGSDASDNPATDLYWHFNPGPDVYCRKVFIGGLPLEVGEDELRATFGRYGNLVVDWPYKRTVNVAPAVSGNAFPANFGLPSKSTGYVFLIYEKAASVEALVGGCYREEGERLYITVGSGRGGKAVQVRPWRLADADFLVNQNRALLPRYTVFVGAVPRPMKAVELAHAMNKIFGGVGYVGIDTDAEWGYPRGSGRIVFWSEEAYVEAIRCRFVGLGVGSSGEAEKRVEVKPYVMEGQRCSACSGPSAALFCPNPPCLAYFCDRCFGPAHATNPALAGHQPALRQPLPHPRHHHLPNLRPPY